MKQSKKEKKFKKKKRKKERDYDESQRLPGSTKFTVSCIIILLPASDSIVYWRWMFIFLTIQASQMHIRDTEATTGQCSECHVYGEGMLSNKIADESLHMLFLHRLI